MACPANRRIGCTCWKSGATVDWKFGGSSTPSVRPQSIPSTGEFEGAAVGGTAWQPLTAARTPTRASRRTARRDDIGLPLGLGRSRGEERQAATRLDRDLAERRSEDAGDPVLGVVEVVERAAPVERPQHRSTYARMPRRLPEHRRAEERGMWSEHGGDVGHGNGLALGRAGQAMEDGVESGRREWTCNGQRLQDVRLDCRDVQVPKPARDVAEHVGVRVEDGHLAAGRQAGVIDEVAGARSDVEVVRANVPAIHPNPLLGRGAPHVPRDGSQHERVVQSQQELVVIRLAAIRGIVPIHMPSWLDGTSPSPTPSREVTRLWRIAAFSRIPLIWLGGPRGPRSTSRPKGTAMTDEMKTASAVAMQKAAEGLTPAELEAEDV